MNRKRLLPLALVLLTALPAAGCGKPTITDPPPPAATSHGGPVRDVVSLMDHLRGAGATVAPAGEVEQPFFPVRGQMVTVNGSSVQVFEFTDNATAEAAAKGITPDGSSVGADGSVSMITWVAPPHFFRAGKVIALYLGDDRAILTLLEGALGPQIAGK